MYYWYGYDLYVKMKLRIIYEESKYGSTYWRMTLLFIICFKYMLWMKHCILSLMIENKECVKKRTGRLCATSAEKILIINKLGCCMLPVD
jgi:hypothetical protein